MRDESHLEFIKRKRQSTCTYSQVIPFYWCFKDGPDEITFLKEKLEKEKRFDDEDLINSLAYYLTPKGGS
jgi:hypothetical protein